MHSKLSQRKHWRADNGGNGGSANCHGRNAGDLVIHVPPGTVVIDALAGHALEDLSAVDQQVVAARGGRGGKGNLHFKSSVNRAECSCHHAKWASTSFAVQSPITGSSSRSSLIRSMSPAISLCAEVIVRTNSPFSTSAR